MCLKITNMLILCIFINELSYWIECCKLQSGFAGILTGISGIIDTHFHFQTVVVLQTVITRNSSGDEIANVNFLRRHRTRTRAHITFTSLMESTHVHRCHRRP